MTTDDEAPTAMVPAMDGTMAGQITYNRLLRLIQKGEVRGQHVGRKWFVDLADLARWKREQANGSVSDLRNLNTDEFLAFLESAAELLDQLRRK